MRRLACLPLLATFAILSLTPGLAGASGVRSGVDGSVKRGPTQPSCQVGTPCTTPVAGARITFSRGAVVRHARTNKRGRYSIRLAPGTYAVRVSAARFGYTPRKVTVRPGQTSRLNIFIDTGLT
jgi:Carboxypeptidase regulatory-like domain